MHCTMTKKQYITICMMINVLCIVAQIYKHTRWLHYMYCMQQEEKLLDQQEELSVSLAQQLYALHDRTAIKEFAQRELNMRPVALHRIKRFSL